MPLILSFNTNINEYIKLKLYSDFINKIFADNIKLYNASYTLIAFVTQPNQNIWWDISEIFIKNM